jgi:hypothetical protein
MSNRININNKRVYKSEYELLSEYEQEIDRLNKIIVDLQQQNLNMYNYHQGEKDILNAKYDILQYNYKKNCIFLP